MLAVRWFVVVDRPYATVTDTTGGILGLKSSTHLAAVISILVPWVRTTTGIRFRQLDPLRSIFCNQKPPTESPFCERSKE